MSYTLRHVVVVGLLLTAACTTQTAVPATAPPETGTPTSSVAPSSTSVATTTVLPTETQSTPQASPRLGLNEAAAVLGNLERARLTAILGQDDAAFEALYANEAYLDLDRAAFENSSVKDPDALRLSGHELVAQTENCAAIGVTVDSTDALASGGVSRLIIVIERESDAWGYSWIGEGWACDGPHPLSP